MKNNGRLLCAISLSLLGALFLCDAVWAGGESQEGGTSSGSGSVPTCGKSSPIHQVLCNEGKDGGGKSWRVYKVGKKSMNTISKLNNDATWKIVEGKYGGEKISGTLNKCTKHDPVADYLVVLGLDSVANSKKNEFYVAFNQTTPGGECGNNRGCYYYWNNYNAITKTEDIYNGNFTNGQAVTNGVAKKLYKNAKIDDDLEFSEVGTFCAWKEDPKYTLTAKAIDTNGNSLASVIGLGDKSSGLVRKGDEASVKRNTTNAGYTFKGWRTSKTGKIVSTKTTYTEELTKNVTVYAVYEPFSATSTLDIKVKNNDVATYNNFASDGIYAKPGDKLSYKISYEPKAQGGKNLKPQKINIEDIGTKGDNNVTSTIESLFNRYKGNLGSWNNGLIASGPVEKTYSYNKDTTKRTETPDYVILDQNVGSSPLTEKVELQYNSNGTTPEKVEIGLNNGQSVGKVYTKLSKSAKAYVPYNFVNTTCITEDKKCIEGDNPNQIVYANETKTLSPGVKVEARQNNTLGGKYATIVRAAQWKIGVRYGDNPNYEWTTNSETGNLNTQYNRTGGALEIKKSVAIDIPDVNAGSKICFVSAVYPKDSHDDLNIKGNVYDDKDINSWAISPEVCYTVAKKPNLQVWGGNVYTSGAIRTAVSAKKHPADNTKRFFGSWGELGVISNGTVQGFASGASTGYAKNENEIGGSKEKSFCDRVPLTLANFPCNDATPSIGNSVGISSANNGKAAIIAKYLYGGTPNVDNGELNLDNVTGELKDGNIHYYHGNNLTITGSTITPGTTKIVHAKNVTINSDLTYDGPYANLDQMPKLVIYAEENIVIDCEVRNIDALLIAENNVITCDNVEGNYNNPSTAAKKHINDPQNSNQLTIRGAVIAGKLIPNRTYGAATGNNSIVPAEIINFDPSLYRWGNNQDTTTSNHAVDSRLETVYIREAAPRL